MRNSNSLAIVTLAGLLVAGMAPAMAAGGRTTVGGPISSGPGMAYREVGRLSSGLNVTIYGCVAGGDWCDVSWRGHRGWIAAGALEFGDAGKRIAMSTPGARASVPTVVFDSRIYWDQNYSTRVWYGEPALDR